MTPQKAVIASYPPAWRDPPWMKPPPERFPGAAFAASYPWAILFLVRSGATVPATARASLGASRALPRYCAVSGFTDRRRRAGSRASAVCGRGRSPPGTAVPPGKRPSRPESRFSGLPAGGTRSSDQSGPPETLRCRSRNPRAHRHAHASRTGPAAGCGRHRSRGETCGCATKSGRRIVHRTSKGPSGN